MGREIRRVPPGWEHPRRHSVYIPLFGEPYTSALGKWELELGRWKAGTSKFQPALDGPRTEEHFASEIWRRPRAADASDPQPGDHVAFMPEEATSYQIYETVTEGTPVSPVFATEAELVAWLVDQGYSQANAEAFLAVGAVPTGSRGPLGEPVWDIHGAAAILAEQREKQKQEKSRWS